MVGKHFIVGADSGFGREWNRDGYLAMWVMYDNSFGEATSANDYLDRDDVRRLRDHLAQMLEKAAMSDVENQ